MNKKKSIHILLILLSSTLTLMLFGCREAMSTSTPIPQWRPMPTYTYYIPPSAVTEYTHYISKAFEIRLEFDYPSYWWFEEWVDERGAPTLLLRDPRFLTLPTPFGNFPHPVPNDFGYIYIIPISGESGQTPDTELESLRQSYNNHFRYTVLNDFKITVDGYDASVLEYKVEPAQDDYPSVMFGKRIFFMINDQLYEILFMVAEKDRGGEFEQGYEYFLNSLKILP